MAYLLLEDGARFDGEPAATVSSTRPCSRRPPKQQFSERLS